MTQPLSGEAGKATGSWRSAIRGNVLAMGLVSLFNDFSSEMIYPLLAAYLNALTHGAAKFWIALMDGLGEATASLLKVFSGRLSDRLGKRKSITVLGYGLATVCRPLMALATAGWAVVGLRVLDRVGKGVRTSPRDALIGDSVDKDNRGLAFSFHRAMDHAGAVLGPVTAVAVLYFLLGHTFWHSKKEVSGGEITALQWLFALSLIPGLFAMAFLMLKVREIAPARARAEADGRAGRLAGWKNLPGRFYAFVGIVTLFALGNSTDLFILNLGREKFDLDLIPFLALWVVLHLSKILFSFPGGMLSDRVGRRPVIIAGWIVYALVYLGLAVVQAEWQFWTLFVIYGAYYGLTEGAEKALVTDFVASELRGTAFGVYHAAVGIAVLPANLIFAALWSAYGSAAAFGFGAALAGLAAVVLVAFVSLAPPRRSPQPAA